MTAVVHVSSAARRYARALFELAGEAGRLDGVQAQMEALGRLAEDAEYRALLGDPRIDSQPKVSAVRQAFPGEPDALVDGLLRTLGRRGRLALLTEIPEAFRALSDEAAGRLRGDLETAQLIQENQVVALEEALSRHTGRQVSLHATVVPELLGGVRVTLAGTRYDGSARGRLDQITQRLAAADLG